MLNFNQLLINKLILTSLTLKTNHLIIQNDCPTFCPSFAIKINELNIKQNWMKIKEINGTALHCLAIV